MILLKSKGFTKCISTFLICFILLSLINTNLTAIETNNQLEFTQTNSLGDSIGTVDANDTIYQIMVDRFYDGDKSNNIVNYDPNAMRYLENIEDDFKYMHGGDWQGIIDKIDYIKDMGYTAIWISPVTEPQLWNIAGYPSAYHGYNVYDPNRANQYFGVLGDYEASKQKLIELVNVAHDNGIKVIIDVVPNHVGDFLYQKKTYYDQGQEPAAPFNNPNWYHHNGDIDWSQEGNIAHLEDHDLAGLDDIDFDNNDAKLAMFNSIKNWVDSTGADGIRVDAAKCMFPKDIAELEDYVGVNSFGECFDMKPNFVANWIDAEWGMLDFPLFQAIVNCFAKGNNFNDTSWGTISVKNILDQDNVYKGKENNMVTFIDNHDRNRFLTEANGDVKKLQNALIFLFSVRGVPVVFQGTEQNKGNINNIYINGIADIWNRYCMFQKDSNGNIVGDYFNKNTDTYQLVAQLNKLRKDYEALRTGKQREMWIDTNLFAFSRRVENGTNTGQEVISAFNNGTYSRTENIPIRKESTLKVGSTFENAFNKSDVITIKSGGVTGKYVTITVDSNSSKIYVPTSSNPNLIPVKFNINNAYTYWGQNLYIVGNIDELGNWNPANAIGPMECPNYPTWSKIIYLPADTKIEYKAIKKDNNGNIEWQSGGNRFYSVPHSGSGEININF